MPDPRVGNQALGRAARFMRHAIVRQRLQRRHGERVHSMLERVRLCRLTDERLMFLIAQSRLDGPFIRIEPDDL